MEPITTAIIAAVTAGITDIGKKAFGDTYQGLKDPIKSKFGQDNKISKAIAELEDNPESKGRQTILAESMAQEKADRDPELIHLAQQLVRALEETEQGRQAVAEYQIDARGAQIGVTGDKAHIEGWVHFHKAMDGTAFGVLGVANRRRGPGLQLGGHPMEGRRAYHKTIIVIRGQSKKEVPNEKFHGGA